MNIKTICCISLIILSAGCTNKQVPDLLPEVNRKPTNKKTISLNSSGDGAWDLYFGVQDARAPGTPDQLKKSGFRKISARVPGNVEIDLLADGIIEDPMIGTKVYTLRKYESYQWWYHRKFVRPVTGPGERIELCFDGIDCLADIWLNGRKIASVENMFVEHHYDVTDLLRKSNDLFVRIKSTELAARLYLRNHFGVRSDQLGEAVSIRKAPHMFGWDIMPRLLSAGIWRDVKLEIIQPTHFSSVYWVTKEVYPDVKKANMYVDWQFHTDRLSVDDLTMTIELERNGRVIYKKEAPVITTIGRERIWGLEEVDLWWPRGFGEPALYDATIRISDPGGKVLCENNQRIGIRNAKLVLTPINTPENPGDFHFEVNNEPVFIKGTNWVPLDALHSRDIQHADSAVAMLADLNCNMVRMWGGNVYENDRFYDLCDQYGIMVWQDFAMGCTTYPQDAGFRDKVRREAEKVIRRLRHHPSIVLWAGNNENDVSLNWAGDQSHIDPNTDVISRSVLPMAVREWDPKTPYLPSSPFISEEVFRVRNRISPELSPEMHLWGPRGYYKAPFYTENNARFVSEIGYHGCPNLESLEQMMTPESVYPWLPSGDPDKLIWNEEWQCKATRSHPNTPTNKERNFLMVNQIREVFGDCPRELEDFVTASQIVQAEAKKYFIEFWRMNKGERHGILWWNLRDGWPIISDAIVDYYGGRKLAYTYIKRVQTDLCVMAGDAQQNAHPVYLVNDTRDPHQVDIRITESSSGRTLLEKTASIASNGIVRIGSIPGTEKNQLWLIEYDVAGRTFHNHYVAYSPPLSLARYKEWLDLLR